MRLFGYFLWPMSTIAHSKSESIHQHWVRISSLVSAQVGYTGRASNQECWALQSWDGWEQTKVWGAFDGSILWNKQVCFSSGGCREWQVIDGHHLHPDHETENALLHGEPIYWIPDSLTTWSLGSEMIVWPTDQLIVWPSDHVITVQVNLIIPCVGISFLTT